MEARELAYAEGDRSEGGQGGVGGGSRSGGGGREGVVEGGGLERGEEGAGVRFFSFSDFFLGGRRGSERRGSECVSE